MSDSLPHNGPEIREECDADAAAILMVHQAAFGRDGEGRLIDHLRSDGLIVSSAVALIGSEVVANAVCSRLRAQTATRAIKAVALAPVAVMPAYQRQGLGSTVIAHVLRVCAQRGFEIAFVLGDPAYYKRFGFSHEIAKAARSPYSSAGEAWMALPLQSSRIFAEHAEVCYPAAFALVD